MAAGSMLGFGKAVVLAAFLEPQEFGYLAIAEIVVTYGIYACSWGLVHGLRRQVPVMIGSGDTQGVALVLRSATGVLAANCFVALVLHGAVLLSIPVLKGAPLAVGFLAGVLSVLNVFFFLAALQLASHERFVTFSLYSLLKSGAVFALAVALGRAYGAVGAVAGEALGLVLVVTWLGLFNKLFHRPLWQGALQRLGQTYRVGLPLAGQAALRSLAANLDKVLLAISVGPAGLGMYNFALLQVAAVLVLVNLLGLYLGPKLFLAYGRSGSVMDGRRLLGKIILGSAIVAAVLYPVAEKIFVWGIPLYFAQYSQVLELIKLFYVGALLHIVTLYELIFVALGRVYLYLGLTGAMAVAFGVVYGMLAWWGAPLIAFGLAYVLVRGLAAVVTMFMAARAAADVPAKG